MAWLLRDGEVLASCDDVTVAPLSRLPVGLPVGAQLVKAKRLHFAGARGADVASLDGERTVATLSSLGPWRPVISKRSGSTLVVARRGTFARWGIELGDHLEVR